MTLADSVLLRPARAAQLMLLAVCLVLVPACQRKHEILKGMGPLTPFLDIGPSGVWTGAIKNGVYSLTNATEPRALRSITLLRTDEPKYAVGVDIAFNGKTDGMAGLVLAQTGTRQYRLLAMRPDGHVMLYWRTVAHLTKEMEVKTQLKAGFNRLGFEGEGNSITILVNGHKVATAVAQGLAEGGAGIAALGVGSFAFTGFAATGYYRDTGAADTSEGTPASQSK